MSAIPFIRQGSHQIFQFDLDGESLSGFTLTMIVKKRPKDDALIEREIEFINSKWTGYITSEESATLPIGRYELVAIIENPTTLEKKQIPKRLQVITSWDTS